MRISSDSVYSLEFRIKVIVEAALGKDPIVKIAEKYNISPEKILEWRDAFFNFTDLLKHVDASQDVGKKMHQLLENKSFAYDEYIFGKIILDNTTNLVNICDVETYEVLYMNDVCKQAYGIDDNQYVGKKCYNIFYGFDTPCTFCTTPKLYQNGIYQWRTRNPIQAKHYQLTDRLLHLDGRKVRLEIGVDVENDVNQLKELDSQVEMNNTLLACIRTLTETEDMKQAIEKILENVCTYHQGNRGYIFELNADGTLLNNTYEWCAPGVSREIDNLQQIPKEVAADWFVNFEQKGSFYISSLNTDLDPSSADYRILNDQSIQSLIAAPLMEDGQITGFIGVDDPQHQVNDFSLLGSVPYFILNDIQKRSLVLELERLSYIDGLTKLHNRNKYIKDLEMLEREPPESLGVIYIDLNGLKLANDRFGHHYGDHRLKQMANLITSSMGKHNVYRIGGDEFIALCINQPKEVFETNVAAFRNLVASSNELTASIGTTWEEKQYNIHDLIKHADDLMYANKQRYYNSIDGADYNHNSAMAKQLLRDLESGGYVVYLQPKIFLADGSLHGAEALIRGLDPDGKIIPPDCFIPVFESQGIIRHIDFFVLETVCKLIRDLKQEGKDLNNVSVNFSRITLLEYDVVSQMQEICQKYDIPPECIIIEVTESTEKLQLNELSELAYNIKDIGFQISLDDYGSKYSNISILSSIGFDEIKLDQSIINKLTVNEKTRTITQHTIQMLKDLKMCKVVAEGIETAAEMDIVKGYGCDYGQGYHFSRPIPIVDFLDKYFP